MATNDERYDAALRRQRSMLDDNHATETRLYRDMQADSDAAYDALKTQARIDRALSELAGGSARSSATLRARDESAMRNELGDTERQRERFADNVEHALAGLTRKKDADAVITENMDIARRTAAELSQRQFDAELNLQQQYHELNEKNSLFDQMYKLYTKRLVNKDQFKDKTGIKVKAMPRPKVYHATSSKATTSLLNKAKEATLMQATSMASQYAPAQYATKTTSASSDANTSGGATGGTSTYTDAKAISTYMDEHSDELKKEFGTANYNIAYNYMTVKAMFEPLAGKEVYQAFTGYDDMMMNPAKYIKELGKAGYYKKMMEEYVKAINELNSLKEVWENEPHKLSFTELSKLFPTVMRDYNYDPLNSEDMDREALDLPPLSLDWNELAKELGYSPEMGGWSDNEIKEMLSQAQTQATEEFAIKFGLPLSDDTETASLVPGGYTGLPIGFLDIWGDGAEFPDESQMQEEMKQKGTSYAKKEAEKAGDAEMGLITDEYAESLGICIYIDEQLEKDGVKIGEAADRETETDALKYIWNPVDWVTQSYIYDEDKLTTGKAALPIIGGTDDIVTYANEAIENILYKKYWNREITNADYAVLTDLGMTDIINYLKNKDVVYEELPENARDAVKRDIIKAGHYAYQDFTAEEMDFLKTASVSQIDERIAEETAKDEPDVQMLNALNLYRYYKNDMGIQVTGDYEADRTVARTLFVDRMCELTQSNNFDEVILKMHDMFDGADEVGYELHYTDELLEARELWTQAPSELFANIMEETEAAYHSKDAAYVVAVRDAFSLGASQLQKETEVDPSVLKYMALQGHQVGGTEFYKSGRFYNPSLAEESAMMKQNNPDAYMFGSISGGLPAMVATGNFFGDMAQVLGVTGRGINAISGAVPMAIKGGIQSAAEGDNIGEIIVKTFFWSGTGAFSFGPAADKVSGALGTLLKNAPALVQKVIPSLFGAGTTTLANAGVNLLADTLSGQEVDIQQVLAGMAVDAVFALFLSGKSGDNYLDPQTGKKIDVPEGKTLADVDPEAASFYKGLGERRMDGELHNAMGDIYLNYMDIPESMVSRSEFAPLETAYRNYEANPTVSNAAAFVNEAGKVQRLASSNWYNVDSPYVKVNAAMEADAAKRLGTAGAIGGGDSGGNGGSDAGFAEGYSPNRQADDGDVVPNDDGRVAKVDGEGNVKYNIPNDQLESIDTIKYYRVQTPSKKGSMERIVVKSDGTIKIVTSKANLNLSYGTLEHARYFQKLKGGDSYIIEFEVDGWFHRFVLENAVPQEGYRTNILNQEKTAPKVVDKNTPGKSMEFPPIWNEWFEEYAKNARIIK